MLLHLGSKSVPFIITVNNSIVYVELGQHVSWVYFLTVLVRSFLRVLTQFPCVSDCSDHLGVHVSRLACFLRGGGGGAVLTLARSGTSLCAELNNNWMCMAHTSSEQRPKRPSRLSKLLNSLTAEATRKWMSFLDDLEHVDFRGNVNPQLFVKTQLEVGTHRKKIWCSALEKQLQSCMAYDSFTVSLW